MTASIPASEHRRRIMGAWLGKAVGGTLGMPYEGVTDALDLTYYNPVPTDMLPNDDLDLQVVYACLLDQLAQVRVDRLHLAGAWSHIGMSPDEYGVCKRNLALGLKPPVTGSYDNPFTDGMGAAIRSELWACLAPGSPDLAAAYAYEDACMDHAGEGIYAAQFLAALEALAFTHQDREYLLDRAETQIPFTCRVRRAIHDTRLWWQDTRDWREVRRRVIKHYGRDNFTDVAPNLAFIVLGWLAGEGDFGRSICIGVNCGWDTDCTGATLGALLGILNPQSIEARWLKPIGRNLVLSPSITGIQAPSTLDDLTDLVLRLHDRLGQRPPEITPLTQDTAPLAVKAQIGILPTHRLGSIKPLPAPVQATAMAEFSDSSKKTLTTLMPADTREVTLPGLVGRWPVPPGQILMVKYRVHLAEARSAKLIFNTPQACRVWLDDQPLLARDAGAYVPAFHRTPLHQSAIVQLSQGPHTITAAIKATEASPEVTWVIGLGEDTAHPVAANWLIDVFEHVGRGPAAR